MCAEEMNIVMKKTLFRLIALALALVCLGTAAVAETWYVKTPNGKTVNLRDEKTNEVIGYIPYGTQLESDAKKDSQTAAYVTYNGKSGYVKYSFLVKEKPAAYKKKASAATKTESETLEPVTYGDGTHAITVTGGVVQMTNKKGKATGTKYNAVRFDDPVTVVVTASVPRGKKISYWVVNGIKMKLGVKTFTIVEAEEDVTVEIVYK